MPNFVNPGALAADAIQQQMLLRMQLQRQAMRDQLELEDRASERGDRERRIRLEEEQTRIARNQAGVNEMERAAAMASRQQAEQRAAEDRARQLSEAANQRGMRQMIGDAMMQGPMTGDRARQIAGMSISEGVDVPAVIAQQAFPKTERRVLNPGDILYDEGTGKEIARGLPQRQPVGPTPPRTRYVTLTGPGGRQKQVEEGPAASALMDQGWKMLQARRGGLFDDLGEEDEADAEAIGGVEDPGDTLTVSAGQLAQAAAANGVTLEQARDILERQAAAQGRRVIIGPSMMPSHGGAAVPPSLAGGSRVP